MFDNEFSCGKCECVGGGEGVWVRGDECVKGRVVST